MHKLAIDLIVFDLDGTLADTLADLAAAANYVCRHLKLPEHPAAAVQEMIGGGELNFVRRFIGEGSQGCFGEALELYVDYYSRHCAEATRLYPGVKETLAALAPRRLAVLSNKRESHSRLVLQALGIAPFFRVIRGGDSYGALKPSPEGLLALVRELGAQPGGTLMVGDKPGDVLAGRGAGSWTAAVTYGYGDPAQIAAAAPDLVLSDLTTLPEALSS